jgi:hypothetical protein
MTHDIGTMLRTHPDAGGSADHERLAACIRACLDCAQACTACADACLSEDMVDRMAACIRTDQDCADICAATARILSRQTAFDAEAARAVLTACATLCGRCGAECESHADMHEHCRLCAAACRRCEEACRDLLSSLG